MGRAAASLFSRAAEVRRVAPADRLLDGEIVYSSGWRALTFDSMQMRLAPRRDPHPQALSLRFPLSFNRLDRPALEGRQ